MKHFYLDVFFRDDGAPHLKSMNGNRVVCWLVKVIMFQHTWELWGSLLRHQWFKKKKTGWGNPLEVWCSFLPVRKTWRIGVKVDLSIYDGTQWPRTLLKLLMLGFSGTCHSFASHQDTCCLRSFISTTFFTFSLLSSNIILTAITELKVMVLSLPSLAFGDLLGSKGGTLVDVRYRYICIQ